MQKPLTPRVKISSEGKVYYNESFQAWNTLKLKKELFAEFPQLKEKRSKFSYKLAYYRDHEKFLEEIKGMMKSGESMPLLIWLFKEK
ncbi:hypothetical protein J4226_01750 [Candidatus Pacearchaeota archaeon]|nr:hypothetical protein [Candidatus Pacearchaeota archaeon]